MTKNTHKLKMNGSNVRSNDIGPKNKLSQKAGLELNYNMSQFSSHKNDIKKQFTSFVPK